MRVNVRFSDHVDIQLLEKKTNKSRFIRELVHQVATGELIKKSDALNWILEGGIVVRQKNVQENQTIDLSIQEKESIQQILEWEE